MSTDRPGDMRPHAAGPEPTAWQRLAPLVDLATPMAVRAVVTLRIPDLLADGPLSAGELAEASGTDAEALTRVLRLLAARGVFDRPDAERFANASLAELLRADHPSGMVTQFDLDGFGGRMDLAFTGIMHTLRTGRPAFEEVFGAPFWEYLSAYPDMAEGFDAMMASAPEYVRDVVGAFEWPADGRIVDVGGGTGALLSAILREVPDARGTVVDLPDTARRAREQLARQGLSARCDAVGNSFFDPLPVFPDAPSVTYVLSNVLHDWPDEEAVAVLRRCAEAVDVHPDGGLVLVVEGPGTADGAGGAAGAADGAGDPGGTVEGPDNDNDNANDNAADADSHADTRGAVDFAEMDLRMLVLAGGRQRRVPDYERLAGFAGLAPTGSRTTPLGQCIIAFRPAPVT